MSKHHKTVIARNEAISQLSQSWAGKPTTLPVIARNEAISQLCQSRTEVYFSKRLPTAIALLFCLTLSLNSIAQKKDTIGAKTMYDLLQQIKKQPDTSDPLVMVDDSVFKGDLHKIDEQNVREVQVIRGDGAKVIYGPNAKNGVFIIKTKTRVLNTFIQPENLPPPPKPRKVMYVVDGEVVDMMQVNPSVILEKKILLKEDMKNAFPDSPIDSLVLITTKAGAVKAYQNKFSAFSKDYKQYIENNNDDKFCTYFVDGKSVENDDKDFISKLFDLPANKIKSVVIQSPKPAENWIGLKVFITTKK